MKILKIYPSKDTKDRYNYHINYDIWDKIEGYSVILETKSYLSKLDNYDIVFLPMYKRWENHYDILNKLKSHKIKTILFDNDTCYRSFDLPFYEGIDFIFYRHPDINGLAPMKTNSDWLPWSIDTQIYKPKYGGNDILYNCIISEAYPLREKISEIIKPKKGKGIKYIENIQNAAAAIHADSDILQEARAKILEFGSCGTEIISNRTKKMEYYYPDDLIIYFDDITDLNYIIKNYSVDIDNQRKLREITETFHDSRIRAKEVISILEQNS